jgi:hypothetical protein
MRKPTMTLEDIQRALEEQDCQLRAACRELADEGSERKLAITLRAFESLASACEQQLPSRNHPKPCSGVRC